MNKLLSSLLCFLAASAFAYAVEVKLTDFTDLAGAEKIGWSSRSSASLSVPSAGVLRCQGQDKKRYCGMQLAKLPLPDHAGAIRCKVKMNFGKHVYFALAADNGYFDCFFPIKNNVEQNITVPLDIKKWRYRGRGRQPEQFGNIKLLVIMHPDMKKSSEFIEISELTFPAKDEKAPVEKSILHANAVTLAGSIAEFSFSPVNGSLLAVKDKRNGKFMVQNVENHYFLQSTSGDAEAFEKHDKVVKKQITPQRLTFICENPDLSGLKIEKIYFVEHDRLRRKTVFRSQRNDIAFITPRTRVRFMPDFYRNGFYLGSGYIGPLMEVPQISSPQQERSFLQTSKGMLLYHDGEVGSFAQYRTHLNGKFVFPWWQSAIATYQEKANALIYHPDGWEMALGSVDVLPEKSFSIEDTFVFFSGNWHKFLNKIYTQDPVVRKVLNSFRSGPEWLNDVKVQLSCTNINDFKKLSLLLDKGQIIAMIGQTGSWGDYHFDTPRPGMYGGWLTAGELKALAAEVRNISPAFRIGIYNWVNSAMGNSDVVKRNPEFFMFKTRNGQDKNLFPGHYDINYPVMMNRPAARTFMLDNFRSLIDTFNFDFIYLDETKTVSLIDWQRNDLMRDDHWAEFWLGMHKLGQEKNVLMFGNGRGNPYHELNYIEARRQLAPAYWRKFCGMAMAVNCFVNQRPGARVDLLYWNPGMDYITRVLANGFIPTVNFLRYQQIPYITANYELGKSSIFDLQYTPDWKYDGTAELESYVIRRDNGGEVVMSLINRSNQNKVQVKINTTELPENLAVWAYRVVKYVDKPSKYGFGEKERKANYRTSQWREGVITRPELLFMGKNPRQLELELDRFGRDEFIQIVFTSAAAGVYSVNDLVQNYFLMRQKPVSVSGFEDVITVESATDSAEVVIFRSPGCYEINGERMMASPVRFGNKLFAVLPVKKGRSIIRKIEDILPESGPFQLQYQDGQLQYSGSGYVTVSNQDDILLYCGKNPVLPQYHHEQEIVIKSLDGQQSQKLKIVQGKPSPAMLLQEERLQRAKLNIKPCKPRRSVDGAVICGSAEYTSRWRNNSGIQAEIPPLHASADLQTLTAEAGTTRRVLDFSGVAAAGFLLDRAEKVELKLTHSFAQAGGIFTQHVNRYRRNRGEFAGIMLDFETVNKKFVRKALSIGVLNYNIAQVGGHAYGAKKVAEEVYLLGEWVDDRSDKIFTLDLHKLAPRDWSGRVYISAACSFVNPDRRVRLELLRFNQAVQSPVVPVVKWQDFITEAQQPRRVQIQQAGRKVDLEQMKKNPLPGNFYKLGLAGFSDAVKNAALAADDEYIYAELEVAMASSINQVEFWLIGSNKKVWQFTAFSDGSSTAVCDLQPFHDQQLQIKVNAQRNFVFAIPRRLLDGKNKNARYRFNLACYRQVSSNGKSAFATYSALLKSFYEPQNFAYLEVK